MVGIFQCHSLVFGGVVGGMCWGCGLLFLEDMNFLLGMVILQLAMLVYWRVIIFHTEGFPK